jgi:hypothetical protein
MIGVEVIPRAAVRHRDRLALDADGVVPVDAAARLFGEHA